MPKRRWLHWLLALIGVAAVVLVAWGTWQEIEYRKVQVGIDVEEAIRILGPPDNASPGVTIGKLGRHAGGPTVGVNADVYHTWKRGLMTTYIAEKNGKVVYFAKEFLAP